MHKVMHIYKEIELLSFFIKKLLYYWIDFWEEEKRIIMTLGEEMQLE